MTVRLAAAIVVHDDKVLVVRRSVRERFLPGVWGVPCGKVDASYGEHPRQAALRELNEETGLHGKVICYVGRSRFVSYWQDKVTANVQRNYLVRPLPSRDAKYEDQTGTAFADNKSTAQFVVKLPEVDQAYEWVDRISLSGFGLDELNFKAIRKAFAPWILMRATDIATQHARSSFWSTCPRRPQLPDLSSSNHRSATAESNVDSASNIHR